MKEPTQTEKEEIIKFVEEAGVKVGNYVLEVCKEKGSRYSISVLLNVLESMVRADPNGLTIILQIIHSLSRMVYKNERPVEKSQERTPS